MTSPGLKQEDGENEEDDGYGDGLSHPLYGDGSGWENPVTFIAQRTPSQSEEEEEGQPGVAAVKIEPQEEEQQRPKTPPSLLAEAAPTK